MMLGQGRGQFPRKNVVSAAKTRADYLERMEETAVTEQGMAEVSPLTTRP